MSDEQATTEARRLARAFSDALSERDPSVAAHWDILTEVQKDDLEATFKGLLDAGKLYPAGAPQTAEAIAQAFHETYERLAPAMGYATRPESAKPWEDVPETNRNLMIAVVGDLLDAGKLRPPKIPANFDRNDHYVPPGLKLDERSSGIVAEVFRPRLAARIEHYGPDMFRAANSIMQAITASSPDSQHTEAENRTFWNELVRQAGIWEARYRDTVRLAEGDALHKVRVELAGADELNGGVEGGRRWFWADVEGDGSHWSRFEGHLMQVDVELHTYNERDRNDWKGRDEIRARGEWMLKLNRQEMGDGHFGDDIGAALRRIDRLIEKLRHHEALDHRIATPYKDQLRGRRVYYHEHPAVVESLTGDGCVMLRVVGAEYFPAAPWRSTSSELDSEAKVELVSDHIWWWRDQAQPGEPATQAAWVELFEREAAEREAQYAEARKFKVRGLDEFGEVVATDAVDIEVPPEAGGTVPIEVTPDEDPADTPTEGALWERES